LAFGIELRSSGQKARLGLQPLADDGGARFAISGPDLWEGVVHDLIALDAERVLDDLGGAVTVVAADGLIEQLVMGGGNRRSLCFFGSLTVRNSSSVDHAFVEIARNVL
jgi:hypothetical protein